MAVASDRAGTDAHAPALLRDARMILVPRGTWRYPDPGRLLAARFGASARTVVADLGVLQQTLFTRACAAIAAGELDVALVCGAEAKYRDLRARIAGIELSDVRAGRRRARRGAAPRNGDHAARRDRRGADQRAIAVLGDRVGGARGSRRVGCRQRARDRRAVGGVQPGRGAQPRCVATRSGDTRLPRSPLGGEPDARGAVHEMALLAVECRSGGRVHPLLGGRRRRATACLATGGCSRSPQSSRTTWCRSCGAPSCTARRR